MIGPVRRVFAAEPDLNPREVIMEFRLTYAGRLLTRNERRERQRSLHVHDIRKEFHKQLKVLWESHPILRQVSKDGSTIELYSGSGAPPLNQIFPHDGFNWLPLVTKANGLICAIDVLMLRRGPPGEALSDIDNRLKPIFDALRMAGSPDELGAGTATGQAQPGTGENPFYVVLEDDKLITHLSATTDTLLEPVVGVPPREAVRLVVNHDPPISRISRNGRLCLAGLQCLVPAPGRHGLPARCPPLSRFGGIRASRLHAWFMVRGALGLLPMCPQQLYPSIGYSPASYIQ